MRIASEHILVGLGPAAARVEASTALAEVRDAIRTVVWPPGATNFTIHPQSGKRGGEGNGVVPIREAFVKNAVDKGWDSERPFPVTAPREKSDLGPIDVSKLFGADLVAAEWETGNVSSSHRTVNKLFLGLVEGVLSAGIWIVPTRQLARYLTDRIGNLEEVRRYFDLWRRIPIVDGLLLVIGVEQDAESLDVPRIRKGTDGRAKG